MIVINVKDNEPIEKALRRYKRKVRDTQLISQLRKRRYYEKDSVKRRNAVLKAAYREQHLRDD